MGSEMCIRDRLVDDRFVKRAIESAGGLQRFGFPDSYRRTETVQA